MKCIHCDNNVQENSVICEFCGKNPAAPAGYVRDEKSGLYYMSVDGVDPQNGRRTKVVTCYNPVSGEYSQETRSIPDGFWYHAESGLHRLVAKAMHPETGAPIKVVTWFDHHTGQYTQDVHDIEPEHAEESQPGLQEQQGASTAPPTEPESTPQAVAEPSTEPESAPQVAAESSPEPESAPQVVAESLPEPESAPQVAATPAPEAPQQEPAWDAATESSLPEAAIMLAEQPEPDSEIVTADTQPEERLDSDAAIIAAHEEEFAQLEDSQEPDLSSIEETAPRKKKKHRWFFAVTLIFLLLACAAAGYYFGYYDNLVGVINKPEIENITIPPQGADIPAFSQAEPVELIPEIVEESAPEPLEAELPEEPETPLFPESSVNYYPQLAHVSAFYSRAAQDENYIYYLPAGKISPFSETKDIMRVHADTGKPETVKNLWPGTNSIYSFALFEDNVAVCALRPENDGYGFYLAPKEGGEPYLLLETDSPAIINVYGSKLYMFFAAEQQIAVVDPENIGDTVYLDMSIDGSNGGYAEYLPEFSVSGGYIYYALAFQNGQTVEYGRQALDSIERSSTFSPGGLMETWTVNPIWDSDGNVYYGQQSFATNVYSFKTYEPAAGAREIMSFAIPKGIPPILVEAGDNEFIALMEPDKLCKYQLGTLELLLSVELQGKPYAATRDYLVAEDGLYRISDLSWIAFIQ